MTTQLPLFSPGPPPDTEFVGVYDIPQAVRYIYGSRLAHEIYRVDSKKLIRWIRNGVASPGLARLPANRMIITFEDLVSLRVIAALRAANVNFRAIYSAEEWLRNKTGAGRPFATEIVWTEGSGIFIELHERLISASKYGQLAMDVLREYLVPVHGLTFKNRLASTWEPSGGVLLDPVVQFGAPCVKGTRVPTRSIWGMIEAGDSPGWVAESYRLSEEEVEAAIAWENSIAA